MAATAKTTKPIRMIWKSVIGVSAGGLGLGSLGLLCVQPLFTGGHSERVTCTW